MKAFVRNLLIVLAVVMAVASCGRNARVIPRKTMSKICVDMLMADAWMSAQPQEVRRETDSMAVYEPIFNKYGYSLDDYLHSVDHYLNDPARFAKMILRARNMLEARQQELDLVIGDGDGGAAAEDSLSAGRKRRSRAARAEGTLNEEEVKQ